MRRMLSYKVLPWIDKLKNGERSFSLVKTFSTFGLTETYINEQLAGLTEKVPEIKLGLCVRFPIIYVKLYVRSKNKERANTLLEKFSAFVFNKIGEFAFSAEGESIEAVVGKATIGVAESCTGGLISNLLTNVPGSSDYFLFSGVTYSNQSKIKVLGVSKLILKKYGAVHEETAKEMADSARRIVGATYGISTSGIRRA